MKFNKIPQKGNNKFNKPSNNKKHFNKDKQNGGKTSFKKYDPTKKKQHKQTPSGLNEDEEIKQLQLKYETIPATTDITSFKDFPLSRKTSKGLRTCGYLVPTAIQKSAIGYALQGKNVLGSAITGSGKTLAFLIPVMENLFLKKWSRTDGVGAIIISPTRELALQIFETLKKIGGAHDFSAGLVTGGKDWKFERTRISQCNVIICTPGRLAHHMNVTEGFDCDSCQILVVDEADRCLDAKFAEDMDIIIENLSRIKPQTLLYSATQTKSPEDLTRLCLSESNLVEVAPHEQAAFSTPDALQQNYVVISLEDKITMLWSFIKNHLKQKCIVFLSTCKQVKYIYEIFCKLRPGTSVIALYGTLHQQRRMAIYNEFCRKSNVVLFATDIASRGLDFPSVNWVIQLDCPEDATAYIHRAGRSARHKAHGENLLVLMPSEEEAMVAQLKERKIPINKISIDPRKMFTPRAKMEAFLAQNKELKETAQRAFVSYIKSVALMKNKKIFDVTALDTDAYARSLGLAVAPRVRFLSRLKKHRENNRRKQLGEKELPENDSESESNASSEDKDEDSDSSETVKPSTSSATKESLNFNLPSDGSDSEEDDDDAFIKIKRQNHEILEDQLPEVPSLEEEKSRNKKPLTKAALAKRVIKKKIMANKKVVFTEDGEEIIDTAKTLQSDLAKHYANDEDGGIDIEKAKNLLREEDKFDKARFKLLVKARHQEQKKSKKADGDQEQFDDFGSDDESDVPDLSWLPDPDKVYSEQSDDDNDSDTEYRGKHRQVVNSSDESDEEEEQQIHIPKKLVAKKKGRIEKDSSDDDEDYEQEPPHKKTRKLASKLSVNEAELLAMQLLGGGT